MLDKETIYKYRSEFGVVSSSIYLDHAGVAPIPGRVRDVVSEFLSRASEKAILDYDSWMERVQEVRSASATLVGSDIDEIAFTKNTSHGISLVSGGIEWNQGDNVIVTEKEFPSNVYPWMDLESKGVDVRTAPFKDGRISIDDIKAIIDERTRLVSVSHVQSVNGFRIDLKNLGRVCKESGTLLFVDAIQSLGVVPMNVKEYGVDFLSADGHKWLLAPEGTGIFYAKRDLCPALKPGLIGWNSVENQDDFNNIDYTLKCNAGRFEEGSYNVMGIYAFGASIDMLLEIGVSNILERVLGLGELIISEADHRGFQIESPRSSEERGGIVSFRGNFDPPSIRQKLMENSVVVNERGGALRLAPHFYNTEEDILGFFSELDKILNGS